MSEISIVGAGVSGLCVASELLARGVKTHIFDRHGNIGPHACSWWAGGMLAPFCEGATAEEAVVRLGQQAASWWQQHAGHVVQRGTLVVTLARDRSELERFARRTRGHRRLQAEELASLEPDLAGRAGEALYFADEAHLDPRRALQALCARLAAAGNGIQTREVRPEELPGRVIDCRGIAARDSLARLRGVKGEMLLLRCPELRLTRPLRLLHPRHPLYIVPRGEGIYMLGATQIESGERGRVTARSLLELLSAAWALHPAFGEAELLECGADVRPAFPDNLPRIERQGRLMHVNGLFRHGFLLAPALARMVANFLLDAEEPELGTC